LGEHPLVSLAVIMTEVDDLTVSVIGQVEGDEVALLLRFLCRESVRARGSPDAKRAFTCDDLLMRPTVVIVDDHAGFRSSARAVLEAEGFDVVGEADDGESALATIGRLRPRVVLLDIQLPDIDGFEVAERLAGEADSPAVVLISTRGVSSYRRRLARSPVRGFISKSELSGNALWALVS